MGWKWLLRTFNPEFVIEFGFYKLVLCLGELRNIHSFVKAEVFLGNQNLILVVSSKVCSLDAQGFVLYGGLGLFLWWCMLFFFPTFSEHTEGLFTD